MAFPLAPNRPLRRTLQAGMRLVVAQVDTKRIELAGGDRAQLSPIRFWTEQPYGKIPDRVGLLNAGGKQELIVYVLDPEQRYESKNYKNLVPAHQCRGRLLGQGTHR